MSVTGAVVILIVAVLIWLAIAALGLVRRVNQTRRRVEGLKGAPLLISMRNSSADLEKINRAALELPAQIAALLTAQAKLAASVGHLRNISLDKDLAFLRRAYAELTAALL